MMNAIKQKVGAMLLTAGIRPADLVVVAVSGGVDSMSLLDILRELKYSILVVHVNHGLRQEAGQDERLVLRYCDKYQLPCVVEKIKLTKKSGIEEQARELRYAVLRRVARENQSKWIVTAHTADDQVETVLANWLRGSAVRGLGGMRLVSDGIVRPVLNMHKTDLMAYAKTRKIKYAVDKSNWDLKFTRNRIRHQLLPELRKFNPQVDSQLLFNAQIWQQVEQAVTTLARQYLASMAKSTSRGVVISISRLYELTPLMQIEVIKQAIGKVLVGVGRSHFEEVMKILNSPRSQVAKRRIGGGLFVSKSRDKITISQE